MTRAYDAYKEDMVPDSLDDHIWRMELDMEIEREYKEWEAKQRQLRPTKISIGRTKNRVKNRKFENYGTRITIGRRLPKNILPF